MIVEQDPNSVDRMIAKIGQIMAPSSALPGKKRSRAAMLSMTLMVAVLAVLAVLQRAWFQQLHSRREATHAEQAIVGRPVRIAKADAPEAREVPVPARPAVRNRWAGVTHAKFTGHGHRSSRIIPASKPLRGSSSYIAEPLAGEALRLALVEDKRQTHDLNIRELTRTVPR